MWKQGELTTHVGAMIKKKQVSLLFWLHPHLVATLTATGAAGKCARTTLILVRHTGNLRANEEGCRLSTIWRNIGWITNASRSIYCNTGAKYKLFSRRRFSDNPGFIQILITLMRFTFFCYMSSSELHHHSCNWLSYLQGLNELNIFMALWMSYLIYCI